MPRSGLVALKNSVADYFAENGIQAEVHLGLKQRYKWAVPRVVFIPGKYDGSDAPKPMAGGDLEDPEHFTSVNPRELATWRKIVTASIYSFDKTAKTDDAAQIEATESLFEALLRALQNAYDPVTGVTLGAQSVEWGDTTWVLPPGDLGAGQELLFSFTHRGPFFDQIVPSGPIGAFTVNKGPIKESPNTGNAASIGVASNGVAIVTGLWFRGRGDVNQTITLSGAATPANNGCFPISQVISSQALAIANPDAVSDANNGSISWCISGPIGTPVSP